MRKNTEPDWRCRLKSFMTCMTVWAKPHAMSFQSSLKTYWHYASVFRIYLRRLGCKTVGRIAETILLFDTCQHPSWNSRLLCLDSCIEEDSLMEALDFPFRYVRRPGFRHAHGTYAAIRASLAAIRRISVPPAAIDDVQVVGYVVNWQ